ncbi:MAG: DNA repair protein RadA [Bacteroidales bacterium]|nr:DNA repair protein RadA [Bacteroidales bacterium]
MITISNINDKWDEIKSKLSSNTVKMATENGFLESAENWEDLKDYFDDEAKELLNNFIARVNKELGTSAPKKETKPKAPKQPKTPKQKKEFSGEYVEILAPEISFIKRYAALHGKKISTVRDRVRSLLASLQKAIVEKKIRKTSVYANMIIAIQSNLIKILNTDGSVSINIMNIDDLKTLYGGFSVMPNARIIKSYLSIQGKENVKEKAKDLLKRIEKSTDTTGRFTTEISNIKHSLEHYIDGSTDTPEISTQTLAGLYGIANTSAKKKIVSGNALGSIDFLATNFKILPFTGKWKELIGQPSEPFKIMIYGKAGSGKSSCSLQFAQYLAELGKKVLYVADEEKFGYTLQEKMKRFGIAHKNLSIIDKMPSNTSEFDIVFVDSINSIGYEPEDLRKLDKGQSWVYVFQATKEGNFRGSQEFEHDVDTSIVVEDMKAHSVKNRFGGKGEISI